MVLLAIAVLLLLLQGLPSQRAERVVFQDDFDTLNSSRWVHMVSASRGGNEEFQYYTDSRNNSFVRNGVLFLRPTLTAASYGEAFLYTGKLEYPNCNTPPNCSSKASADIVLPIESARITTTGKFSFRYGRLEVRAKLPKGDWIWPAIWLIPEKGRFGAWPRSGEIDVAESRGNARLFNRDTGQPEGVQRVSATLHFGAAVGQDRWAKTHWEREFPTGKSAADGFHLYGMQWSEKGFRFTLDGELFGELPAPPEGFWKLGRLDKEPGGPDPWAEDRMAPFDQKFHLNLNVAVGGRFFPDGLQNLPHPRPWDWCSGAPLRQFWERRDWWLPTWQGEDAAMQVDYVKVFQD